MPWKRVNWHPSRFTQGESIPSFSMRGRRILKTLCYFVGIFFTEMGCLGIIASIYSPSPSMAYIPALLLLFSLSLINMLLFFRTRYRAPCLFWSQYFWAIVAATVGVALILLPEAVFGLNGKEIPPALLACIMMLYGISFLVMAFLKPSLSQQIDESLRRILRAVPGQQMALRDLVACVQQEYVFSETTLSQYISGLSSLEQITLAGTPLQICRLKGTKKAVACAQIQQIASPNLRQEVARVLPLLNEEQGDVGLYLLSETFEDTLICYLMIARAKGKLARTPGGKSPNQLSWPEMMWCLKDCGVSVDTVALSSLREKWRNRAYGIMPSASERQVLMKQAQVLAGFYINYTTLLDDLTHDVSSMR